jgi:hypothetical protein
VGRPDRAARLAVAERGHGACAPVSEVTGGPAGWCGGDIILPAVEACAVSVSGAAGRAGSVAELLSLAALWPQLDELRAAARSRSGGVSCHNRRRHAVSSLVVFHRGSVSASPSCPPMRMRVPEAVPDRSPATSTCPRAACRR